MLIFNELSTSYICGLNKNSLVPSTFSKDFIMLGSCRFGEIALFFETARQYDQETLAFIDYLAEEERLTQAVNIGKDIDVYLKISFLGYEISPVKMSEAMYEFTNECWCPLLWYSERTGLLTPVHEIRELIKGNILKKKNGIQSNVIDWAELKITVSELYRKAIK